MLKRIILCCFIISTFKAFPQFITEHISNQAIYSFLDELASDGLISLNTAVKPYSKSFIADKLAEASQQKEKLTKRQSGELRFYLKTYRPDFAAPDTLKWDEPINVFRKKAHLASSLNPYGLIYKDALFTFVARPIYGINLQQNEHGHVTRTYGGLEVYTTVGHWGMYANLRDNHETELLARPGYFTRETGGAFKENNGGRSGGDFSEMRCGLTYQWKWGDIGLVKDHFVWGDNYHGSNIFSGRTPSFAHIRLHLHPAKWIDFSYVHGWLVSNLIDSSRSYYNTGKYKQVNKQKFLAANLLTIIPVKKLYISLGNSIVYADLGGVHPAYLIPFAFYKSIDHTLNQGIENQNSQMFFNISSMQIRHVHLYVSTFIDEFSITRLKSKTDHNFISWKGGLHVSNVPIRNLSLTAEFTQTTPITYKHDILAVTFESNGYNLGHYLKDNSREIFLALTYRPIPRLCAEADYTLAEHGNEYEYIRGINVAGSPMLKDMTWQSEAIEFGVSYEFLNNTYLSVNYTIGNVKGGNVDGKTGQEYLDMFTASFYQGKTNTLALSFNLGF
jgi:hypothetical protein